MKNFVVFDHTEITPITEGTRGSGENQGVIGMADLPAGRYPACSLHGAMNRMRQGDNVWRCLREGCNAGANWPL